MTTQLLYRTLIVIVSPAGSAPLRCGKFSRGLLRPGRVRFRGGSSDPGFQAMLSGGAIGLGLVIGWAGGFAGTRPTAVAYRIGAGALALFLLAAAGTETMVSGACGLAVAAIGHEAFVAAIRQRRSR